MARTRLAWRARRLDRTVAATLLLHALGGAPHTVFARPTIAPPPLPAPAGAVVRVATERQLQAAVRDLKSNTTILLSPGTYRLTATLQIKGPLTNVRIPGSTNSRDAAVVIGAGLTGP